MALHVPTAPGFAQMLKEGARFYSGIEEAVIRNIEACEDLAATVRSAFGPNGMNKIIINHVDKLFVTNDAATMLSELEVQHPAAKILVLSSQQQDTEAGDGTNFVLILAGALLEHARHLIHMGVSVSDIINGYEQAAAKAAEILPTLVCGKVTDMKDRAQVRPLVRASVMSKQYGRQDLLADLIVDACLSTLKSKDSSGQTFNVDNIRVCKILGSVVESSQVISGMVFQRQAESDVQKSTNCKVAVYTCPFDLLQTETKGTVLIKSADELLNYSKGEESQMERTVSAIAAAVGPGGVVVSGGKVGELALHYANANKLLVVRLASKFDLRRLCSTLGATALPRLDAPTPDEVGHCDSVKVDEIGDTSVVVFKQDHGESDVSTIVVRGSTDNIMDDISRAIDDGVNTFKMISKDPRYLPGAGATEVELARELTAYAATCAGLEQYAIKHFAEALEVVPKTLAESAGARATETLANLHAEHQKGNKNMGFVVQGEQQGIADATTCANNVILDLYLTKHWAIKFAAYAACTVLRVDQIIMAKPAGGPKPKEQKGTLDQDDD